jgi:hypothetical protein
MAKRDLIHNEDFQAYQEDLRKRLENSVANLHAIIMTPSNTFEQIQTKLIKVEAAAAVIAEIELILGFPISYLKGEKENKSNNEMIERHKKKRKNSILEIFMKVITRSAQGREQP